MFKEDWFLDAFKTSSDNDKTLIQTSSVTGKAKKQNVASKGNFSSLNTLNIVFISEGTMMFISLDVKYRPRRLSSTTFAVSSWYLIQTKDIPGQTRIKCCSLCSGGSEVFRSCSKCLKALLFLHVCVIYLGKMEINGICSAAMKHEAWNHIFRLTWKKYCVFFFEGKLWKKPYNAIL